MCGRYALSLRPSVVRQRLSDQNMPADETPADDDDQLGQSYNFAPGYHGLIYRAMTNDRGTDATPLEHHGDEAIEPSPKKVKLSSPRQSDAQAVDGLATKETKYKLQAAKWGLIPSWTKRQPDYASTMRTINCRDDSLLQPGGMWKTMKERKRCVVVAEGFFEWLKKNNGKEKIPHFIKRKDGQLMCFAGLWDCAKYEETDERLYSYSIITTDSNAQLKFLHDRMPVILEPGSESMRIWLDPNNIGWNNELQSFLKPFRGELECYVVDKAVGKPGRSSPNFVVPIDSKDNKKNIANFFGKQKARQEEHETTKPEEGDQDDREMTSKVEDPESNAPLPKPESVSEDEISQAIKKDASELDDEAIINVVDQETENGINKDVSNLQDDDLFEAERTPPKKVYRYDSMTPTPKKTPKIDFLKSPSTASPETTASTQETAGKKRSATSNDTVMKTPTKNGNAKITNFFGK